MEFLNVQGDGFLPVFAHDLDDVPGDQTVERIPELLGGFVRSACHLPALGIYVDEGVASLDVSRIGGHGPLDKIGCIGPHLLVLGDDVIVRTLVGQEDRPPVLLLGFDHHGCGDEVLHDVTPQSVKDRTGCRRNHGHLLCPLLPTVERSLVDVIHLPDGGCVHVPGCSPSVGHPVGQELVRVILWPP